MSRHRILFCDDDADIREIVEISLGMDADFDLTACNSASDLLAAAAASRPDLILLDVMMPELDGPAALARLRADPRTQSVPVVFMTARTQAYERERFIALGTAGVIAKPFDPMMLARHVKDFLSSTAAGRP